MEDLIKKHFEYTLEEEVSPEMMESLREFSFVRSYDKKELLTEAGKPCNYQFFILEGSCYSFYVNEKGDKHALQFAIENYWITDASSYFKNTPAVTTIETLEPTMALLINKNAFEKLCSSHPLFDRFFRKLLQNTLASLHYRIAKIISEDADHRYKEFSLRYPHFVENTSISNCFLFGNQTAIP